MLTIRDHRLTEELARPAMQAILQHAPDVRYLLKFASLQQDGRDRWQMYEVLKALASLRVGWQARHPALQTSLCYQAVLDAIDRLLPDENERSA